MTQFRYGRFVNFYTRSEKHGEKDRFFDIDGTLLDHEKQLPASTYEAIHELKSKGYMWRLRRGERRLCLNRFGKSLASNRLLALTDNMSFLKRSDLQSTA